MVTMPVATLDGATINLDDGQVAELAATFRGPLLRPGDDGYEAARHVWNGLIDRHPALIARCLGTADIVAAVNFARTHQLRVSVRGGGHNVTGSAVCDGGLMIDLALLRAVYVDPEARVARVQPGATWADVDRETQLHGLMTPGGEVSGTGVAGFTLSGGMAATRRKYGLACDNLRSVQIVTADGRVVTASATAHPDLFWAIRGGGGNFGIVSSFEFDLFPLGPEVFSLAVMHKQEDAPALIRQFRDLAPHLPEEISVSLIFWGLPPNPALPAALHWRPIFMLSGLYAGPAAEGEAAFRALRALGTPLIDASGTMTYKQKQQRLDGFVPNGVHAYMKAVSIPALTDEVIDLVARHGATRPSPLTLISIRLLGGAMARVPEDGSAYGNRSAPFNVSYDAISYNPADPAGPTGWGYELANTDGLVSWGRAAAAEMQALTGGSIYLNFTGADEGGEQTVRTAFLGNWDRLVAIKRRYDPANLFRGNSNIVP